MLDEIRYEIGFQMLPNANKKGSPNNDEPFLLFAINCFMPILSGKHT